MLKQFPTFLKSLAVAFSADFLDSAEKQIKAATKKLIAAIRDAVLAALFRMTVCC